MFYYLLFLFLHTYDLRRRAPGCERHLAVGSVVLHHQVHGHVLLDELLVHHADVVQGVETSAAASQPGDAVVEHCEVDTRGYGTLDKVHRQPLVESSPDPL